MSTRAGAVNHEAQTSRIPDLMAGNMNRWQRWRLNRHLRSCAPCREELQRYRRIDEGLAETVPAYLAESRPSEEFMERIRHTIATHPMPAPRRSASLPRLGRLAIPAATAIVAVVAVVVALTLTSGGGATALSLATPVRGTLSITQGGDPVADGTFAYVSPEQWERTTTYHRRPESSRVIAEINVDGQTFSKRGNEPWRQIGGTPADRQPVPGLGELGLTERLFDAVLNLYQLEEGGERDFRGEQLTEFTGVDAGYAARIRDSSLASGGSEAEARAHFQFYAANPPQVTVLADGEERIRAIFITVPLLDAADPMLIEVVVEEFNAQVEIVSPIP